MSLIPSGFAKSASAGGFYDHPIEQSLRFNDDDSAYLSWTPSSAGNRKTWTWSGWVKRGNLGGSETPLFHANSTGTSENDFFQFESDNVLHFRIKNSNSVVAELKTNQVFRDVSSWYHVVLQWDSTQATSSDRIKLYVNGEQVTSFSTETYPSQNTDTSSYNNTVLHTIGAYYYSSVFGGYLDAYLAEVHFIDGQALDASSFGETKSGVWIPKAYAGSYGTNGFYLPFNHDYSVEGFSATTYTGTGSDLYVGGVGFQPDLLWIKQRNGGVYNHQLFDSIRGADQALLPNTTTAEADYNSHKSFDPDGFTVQNALGVNSSGGTYVAWCWDAGSGSPVSNTDGSITSTVKASTTYGFSIVDFTTTSGVETTGHGLSSAPEMIITKKRDGTNNWFTYHTSLGATKFLYLNEVNSAGTSTVWNDTAPTSSVFTTNASQFGVGNFIAYCFHSVSGYSKFGSYTGTGASGNSVTTGFKPAFVMVKRTDSTGSWVIWDSARSATDPRDNNLYPDLSNAEYEGSDVEITFDATGFTLNCATNSRNASGGAYIYMAFADKREAAFWLDQSGNNNDFENNNLTESDISLDSPTNNFATLNPLDTALPSLSEGSLNSGTAGAASWKHCRSTFGLTTGKWYWEYRVSGATDASNGYQTGVLTSSASTTQDPNSSSAGFYTRQNAVKYSNGTNTTTFTTTTADDIIMFALDADTGDMWVGKNGTWENSGVPSTATNPVWTSVPSGVSPMAGIYGSSLSIVANFGQDSSFAGNKTAQGNTDDNGYGDFYYAPPSGYLALCTANLTVPDAMNPALDNSPQDYFNTVLYTGTGASQSITGVGFQPDWLWFKSRSGAQSHALIDAVRGRAYGLSSNSTSAESTSDSDKDLISFDSDGFSLGAAQRWGSVNDSGLSIVSWAWKANGSGVSNTDGSITSTVSANTDAGFSIVSYTGTGSAATVGHGLGVKPEMVILKNRSGIYDWPTWHQNLPNPTTQHFWLNATNAAQIVGSFNSTQPTSSVFSIGTTSEANNSGHNFIAYCFHSVEGFSKAFSYTGNGSTDGSFVYCGFKPAFVMVKNASATGDWFIYDTDRNTYNVNDSRLKPNRSDAEGTGGSYGPDILSNGFKMRTSFGELNGSGNTIIGIAFAETPFRYATAR